MMYEESKRFREERGCIAKFGKWINDESHMDDFGDSINSSSTYIGGENINIISEAGLSRLLTKYDNGRGTFGIITAYRYKNNFGKVLTKKEKIILNRKLRNELNHMNLGVYQLVGHWRECSDPDIEYDDCSKNMIVDVIERSYFVSKSVSLTDDEFENLMLKLTKKYDQDASLLYRDGESYTLYKTGRKDPKGKNLSLGKISQAYSQHVGKMNTPFTFEGIEQPSSVSGAKVMKNDGIKYFIDLI